MENIFVYFVIILLLALLGWFFVNRIKISWIRILMKSGMLAFLLSPAIYLDNDALVFLPAFALILTALFDLDIHIFFKAIIPIIGVWILFYVTGILILKKGGSLINKVKE